MKFDLRKAQAINETTNVANLDASVFDMGGNQIELSTICLNRSVLLVFLRQFG